MMLLLFSSLLIIIVTFILLGTWRNISNMKKNTKFEEAKVFYNFLILGYKDDYFVWPFVIWVKKFLTTSFVVLIGISTNRDVILFYLQWISIIHLIHVFLQIIYKPYEFDSLNNLELLNLGLRTFKSLFLQMTFSDWNPFITWILFAIVYRCHY